MGIEYYLVKPEKKEVFYLAKHFVCPEGIPQYKYGNKPDYISYEDFNDFFWGILKENWNYFADCDITLNDTESIIFDIYQWCAYDKIYFDNDCSDNAKNWLEWKETGDITLLLEKLHERNENN